MKRFAKFVTLLAAAALFALLPAINTLTVSAEEPTTYYLKYVPEKNEWRYHLGTWQDNAGHRELYYLKEYIKDGDLVVIEGGGGALNLELDVSLSNLTFVAAEGAVVTAKSIQDVYVLKNSTVAVNSDIENAYIYDNAVCNLNNNVGNLIFYKDTMDTFSVIVEGTVGHVKVSDAQKTYFDFYGVPANTFYMKEGYLQLDVYQYSQTPPAATPAPAEPNPPSSGEYDDVPKTGDSFFSLYLLGIAAVCLAGGYYLRKKEA